VDKALEKLNLLSTAEKAIAGGGVLMLIASFFDWWHYNAANEVPAEIRGLAEAFGANTSVGYDGWGAPGSTWSVLAIIVSLALLGFVLATKLGGVALPALPPNWTWGMVIGGAAAVVVVLMLLKAWRIMAAPVGGFGIGFFVAVVATAAIAFGGYMIYSEEKAGAARM
jgi:hypothetical protein